MATNEFLWFGDSLVLLYQSITQNCYRLFATDSHIRQSQLRSLTSDSDIRQSIDKHVNGQMTCHFCFFSMLLPPPPLFPIGGRRVGGGYRSLCPCFNTRLYIHTWFQTFLPRKAKKIHTHRHFINLRYLLFFLCPVSPLLFQYRN